ncbi:MAG: dNTP triphosphohydrolase [Phycisphaerae bacterium]|nr:dNTP triphosphohydrolase [Phycisphaerae bacterium]
MSELDISREHADPLAGALSPLAIDRQRIVHSAAFRRLQHKTQVFVAPESDHFRTRLTHTLEVAHQARCLAELLGLSAELAEVVALAHDLGHPPFGHAGEKALNECLRDHGGFEHNRHTLRIVEELEHPYPEFHGLNLTRVVRECLAKHSTRYDRPGAHPLQDGRPPPPEGLVVDLADRLTYALHDLLDGLYAGLLNLDELREVALWRPAYTGPAPAGGDAWRGHLRPATDRIQQRVLEDVVRNTRETGTPNPRLSQEMDGQLSELDHFLLTHLYRSEPLVRADDHARRILAGVFDTLVDNPERLPPRFRKRVPALGVQRVVTDYVAGMTDRFCLEQCARLSDAPPT